MFLLLLSTGFLFKNSLLEVLFSDIILFYICIGYLTRSYVKCYFWGPSFLDLLSAGCISLVFFIFCKDLCDIVKYWLAYLSIEGFDSRPLFGHWVCFKMMSCLNPCLIMGRANEDPQTLGVMWDDLSRVLNLDLEWSISLISFIRTLSF